MNRSGSNPPVAFVPNFLAADEAGTLFEYLKSMPGWKQDYIRFLGRACPLPRLHRWFAVANEPYKWSGIKMLPEPFPDRLHHVLERLHDASGVLFNTALGNLYRDGKDSVSWHSDDEPDLGPDPVIASLSLGATRRFLMRRKDDHSIVQPFDLTHGSLLLMPATTQSIWQHSIPKTSRRVGVRVNLTFRKIYTNRGTS